ncbi:transcription termination/antitermination NusG family protein [Treponema bryantii]|uniref:transcription termination/antitermination NusG family protein n=1 Tax=Treponema bryantii TaxID=163 RepID=UPI0003B62188|nr:transcription termination/antitermination NusG family protein [Treponema bryantii]
MKSHELLLCNGYDGRRKAFRDAATEALKEYFPSAQFFSFERKLYTKRRGWFEAPLFPGYVFFGVEELSADFFKALRQIKGFCRILRDNKNPECIMGEALEELRIFIHNGEHWGISKVQFLPGQKIKAIAGPLVGLEGHIVAINKKKKQITVQSSLTLDGKRFDLLYEDAEVV